MNSVKNSDFARQPSDAPAPPRLTGARGHCSRASAAPGRDRAHGAEHSALLARAHGGLPSSAFLMLKRRVGQRGRAALPSGASTLGWGQHDAVRPRREVAQRGRWATAGAPARRRRQECWQGGLTASGDPAAAACFLALIPWLQNPAMPTPAGSLAIARTSASSITDGALRFACVGRSLGPSQQSCHLGAAIEKELDFS